MGCANLDDLTGRGEGPHRPGDWRRGEAADLNPPAAIPGSEGDRAWDISTAALYFQG
jgi:hypothetical protein